ncbi:GGDEF domain-containing protein [Shewanella submarina]|uniref:Diguanylate cyclase domain-containing protein n=1 Tax=Shewanella submarina TaxID=2016376 RepID=A0ABV7GF35_9GAMM|nr:GGDEF domain-containing protein [Shewanella submarina]MCL1039473.1 GGDEF domain-containing protein [Shewanella submarina]
MEILAITIVCIGLSGLLSALSPAFQIIHMSDYQHNGWMVLLSMIMLFVLGYVGFVWVLASKQVNSVDMVVSAIFCGGGGFVYIITRMSRQTIGDLKRIAEQKHFLAYHDSLTGLPNRLYFYEQLDQLIADTDANFCCMLVDVDNFKPINDTYGHDHGDMVLQTIAKRLQNTIPEGAVPARIGGDELAILLPESDVGHAVEVAQQIQSKLAQPFNCGRFQDPVEASIGIATFPQDGHDRESLLVSADIAMYQAKRSTRSFQVFNSDMELPKAVNYHE